MVKMKRRRRRSHDNGHDEKMSDDSNGDNGFIEMNSGYKNDSRD